MRPAVQQRCQPEHPPQDARTDNLLTKVRICRLRCVLSVFFYSLISWLNYSPKLLQAIASVNLFPPISNLTVNLNDLKLTTATLYSPQLISTRLTVDTTTRFM
uniref:(northern house mosquito) hypothetical protein n=1 Tax=Culex pipiens TaxID=7175 RepID=A0A8D8FY99_CULPI